MHHSDVACVEPAPIECAGSGLGILEVALHHDVAAEQELTLSFAIPGHRLASDWVSNTKVFQAGGPIALASHEARFLIHRLIAPCRVDEAAHRGAGCFRNAVDVFNFEPHLDH